MNKKDGQPVDVRQYTNLVELVGYKPPASLQSTRVKKIQTAAVAAAISRSTDRIFLGDVAVEVEWCINEEERYLGDAPDLDNIVKPILDAMCGPDGILVDDVQVQHIDISWLGGWDSKAGPPYQYRVQVSAVNGLFPRREGLSFVQVGYDKKVCYPVPRQPDLDDKTHESFVSAFAYQAHYGWQENSRPETRVWATPFQPSRVKKFLVRDLSEIPAPKGYEASSQC